MLWIPVCIVLHGFCMDYGQNVREEDLFFSTGQEIERLWRERLRTSYRLAEAEPITNYCGIESRSSRELSLQEAKMFRKGLQNSLEMYI